MLVPGHSKAKSQECNDKKQELCFSNLEVTTILMLCRTGRSRYGKATVWLSWLPKQCFSTPNDGATMAACHPGGRSRQLSRTPASIYSKLGYGYLQISFLAQLESSSGTTKTINDRNCASWAFRVGPVTLPSWTRRKGISP